MEIVSACPCNAVHVLIDMEDGRLDLLSTWFVLSGHPCLLRNGITFTMTRTREKKSAWYKS